MIIEFVTGCVCVSIDSAAAAASLVIICYLKFVGMNLMNLIRSGQVIPAGVRIVNGAEY